MSTFLPSEDSLLGPLRMEQVYDYYDGPLSFLVRDRLDHALFATVAQREGLRTSYWYVPVSEDRIAALAGRALSVSQAITDAEVEQIYRVTVSTDLDVPAVEVVRRTEVPAAQLPEADLFLEGVSDIRPFSAERLAEAAERQGRYLAAFEVQPASDGSETLLPLRQLGPLSSEIQELSDVLPGSVNYAFLRLEAASFVLVLTPYAAETELFTAAESGIGAIRSLLEEAAGDGFAAYAASLSRRQQIHARDFFATVAGAESDIVFIAASPSGSISSVRTPLAKLRAGLFDLRSLKEVTTEKFDVTGYLYSVNHDSGRFGFEEIAPSGRRTKARRWRGEVDKRLIAGLASGYVLLYRAEIVRTVTRDAEAGPESEDRLVRLDRID